MFTDNYNNNFNPMLIIGINIYKKRKILIDINEYNYISKTYNKRKTMRLLKKSIIKTLFRGCDSRSI